MSDTIMFELQANKYNTDIVYDDYRDLSVYLAEEPFNPLKSIVYDHNTLTLPGCEAQYQDVLVESLYNYANTIHLTLKTKDEAHSEVIKKGAAKCGFKVI